MRVQRVLSDELKKYFTCAAHEQRKTSAVFYHNPKPEVIKKAKEWFGEENVKNI